MSYLGSSAAPLPVAFAGVNGQSFNGGTNTFTLSRSVGKTTDIELVVNNVQQNPYDGSYSVSGATLTTAEAVSAGVANVYVGYRDAPLGSFSPTDGSVLTASLAANAVTYAKIQSVTAGKVLGRDTSGAGTVQELPLAFDATTGNAGFGTSTPAADSLVHVFSASDKARVSVQRNGQSKAWFGQDGSGDAYIYNEAAGAIRFYSNSTERARITTGGQRQSTVIGGGGGMWDAFDCRAWVNFNGTGTVAIRGSGNVSSITDSGVGSYRVNFTTAMPDTNYSVTCAARIVGSGGYAIALPDTAVTTSQFAINTRPDPLGADTDAAYVYASFFR
jgi:hypothetical protein